MKTPLFSIILPTYNRRILLQRAVDSVLAQEYTNWELIIIDDGSIDDSKEYINSIKDDRIQYFYQSNKGESNARNVGIQKSAGKYICFLDSDDQLLYSYLSCFNLKIDNTTKILCCGVRILWEDRDKKIDIIPNIDPKLFIKQVLTGSFNLMPFCFEKSVVSSFAEDIELGEDYMFIIPLVAKYKTLNIGQIQCIVYEHQGRFTRSKYKKSRIIEFKKSTLEIIDQNRSELEKVFSSLELDIIIQKKLVAYILGISQHSISSALEIWESNKTEYQLMPMKSKIFWRRVKSILKKLIGQ